MRMGSAARQTSAEDKILPCAQDDKSEVRCESSLAALRMTEKECGGQGAKQREKE